MNVVNEDIATLTTMPKYALDRIGVLTRYCICHYIEESKLKHEDVTTVDLGIGDLLIKQCEDGIRYKFIPSRNLEKAVSETIQTGVSPLVNEAENVFVDRIVKTYKDLL